MIEILTAVTALFAIRYLIFLKKIRNGLTELERSPHTPVTKQLSLSVVIPFRNEDAFLERNIKSLLAQSYPKERCEFIYVNDGSTDRSAEIVAQFDDIRMKILPPESNSQFGKKHALNRGITAASGEFIVCSDADCVYPEHWLNTLAARFGNETGFVSAPVRFKSGRDMFSRLQELEFAGLVLCGAGLIGSGAPMICNGANIAYRKQLFFDVGGFSAERAYTSGDDELLMRKIHERGNQKVVFCFEHDALVSTPANSSIGQFMAQRRRWASKSANYPVGFMLHTLVPVFLFYAGLVCLSIAALLTLQLDAFAFFFLLMMVKSIFEYQVLRFGKHLLNLRITAAQFLLAELLQPFYIVIATIAGLFIGYRWKGREVSR